MTSTIFLTYSCEIGRGSTIVTHGNTRHRCGVEGIDQSLMTAGAAQLADELEALFRRVHKAHGDASASASELESEMQHVAATTLHAALIEVLGASTDEEIPHLWGEEQAAPTTAAAATAAVVHRVRARFGGAQDGSDGELAIAPPFLTHLHTRRPRCCSGC